VPTEFGQLRAPLHAVDEGGTLHRAGFEERSSITAAEAQDRGLVAATGPAGPGEGGLCLTDARLELAVPAGGEPADGWWMTVAYRSPTETNLPVYADRGEGYRETDRWDVHLDGGRPGTALTGLGGPGTRRVRIDVPRGIDACLGAIAFGAIVPR
jgi:hypothetical protein